MAEDIAQVAARFYSSRMRVLPFDFPQSLFDITAMLDLATATHAQFEACLNQPFALQPALVLAEVRALGAARSGTTRAPFALTFRGAPGLRIPQQIHHLENATLGALEIFLVQTGDGPGGSFFEAVFN